MFPRLITYEKHKSFFLFGPRGVGKTSWLRQEFPSALYFDLLNARTYTSLLADPVRLSELIPKDFSDWIVIDEIQRIPELLNEVHRLIEKRKLRFVLTGSSARKLRRSGVNLLAGRALTNYMHPLIPQELGDAFEIRKALTDGFLPSVWSESQASLYLESYVATYLTEEVQQEGLTRNLTAFSRFTEIVTFSQAEVLTMAEVARECKVSEKVVQDYFTILEDLLLAVRLPVFSKKAKRKLISHPKFFLFDVGVFRTLRPRGPLDIEDQIEGASLETLFFQCLRALNDYHRLGYEIFYWRTRNQEEIDFILYGPRGLLAFEVKRNQRLRKEELSSLLLFKKDYPIAKCFLVNLGTETYIENEIKIIPFQECLQKLAEII